MASPYRHPTLLEALLRDLACSTLVLVSSALLQLARRIGTP
jgi:hypothetical protein